MNANKVIPENLVVVRQLLEIHLYKLKGGPISRAFEVPAAKTMPLLVEDFFINYLHF